MSYIGRFAPSPTGSLHFGSLVAAVASYCDARFNQGQWLLRIEDLDKPREVAGATDTILQQLEAFGFEWDGEIVYQSERTAIYQDYLDQLKRSGAVYACVCSRKEITDSAIFNGIDGAIYPKTCFNNARKNPSINHTQNHCWRINVDNAKPITVHDAIQGNMMQILSKDIGDFILKRKDGFFAYQLAVVVDDALQNITHIVRGADLLASTPRQVYLQQLLLLKTPCYAHVPVVTNLAGEKLSKQTLAEPINAKLTTHQLFNALHFLGQNPPSEIKNATLNEAWQWAIKHWCLANISALTL